MTQGQRRWAVCLLGSGLALCGRCCMRATYKWLGLCSRRQLTAVPCPLPAGTTAAAAAAGLLPVPPHLVHRNGGALGQHILVDAVVVVPAIVGLVTLQAFRRAQMLISSEPGGSGRQRRQAGDSAGGRPVVTRRRLLRLCSAAATDSLVHVIAAPAGRSAGWRAWSRRRPARGCAPLARRASAGRRTF